MGLNGGQAGGIQADPAQVWVGVAGHQVTYHLTLAGFDGHIDPVACEGDSLKAFKARDALHQSRGNQGNGARLERGERFTAQESQDFGFIQGKQGALIDVAKAARVLWDKDQRVLVPVHT